MRILKTAMHIIPLLILSLIAGCGGGGGGGTPTGPSPVTPKVYMDPSTLNTANGNAFTLNVNVENVTNLFFANIYVVYDPTKVSYSNSAAGDFLKQGGATVLFDESAQNGLIIIGVSRQGSSAGGASGSGTLCTITFNAIATGSTSVNFSPNDLGFRDVSNSDIQITVGNGTTVNIL